MRFYYSIASTSKLDRSVFSLIQQYGIKGFITSHQWSITWVLNEVNIYIWIFVYLKLTPPPRSLFWSTVFDSVEDFN